MKQGLRLPHTVQRSPSNECTHCTHTHLLVQGGHLLLAGGGEEKALHLGLQRVILQHTTHTHTHTNTHTEIATVTLVKHTHKLQYISSLHQLQLSLYHEAFQERPLETNRVTYGIHYAEEGERNNRTLGNLIANEAGMD